MFRIFTDTSANLPSPMLEKHQVGVIPFTYIIDDVEQCCLDTEHFDGERYYGEIKKGMLVTTSQINPEAYEKAFRPVLEVGEDILFVGMSSGISGAHNSANIATDELLEEFPERKIRLVDTLAASLGEGICVLHAIDCKNNGMSLDDTADYLTELRKNVCQVFTVDDLKHLWRTGRCSRTTALVGSALNFKPLLAGNEKGEIVTIGKKRGRKASIKYLAEKYAELVERPEKQIVGIAHAGCEEDAAYLKKLLIQSCPPRRILIVDYEPVTGAHVGPGALALFFEAQSDNRTVIQEG